MYSHKNTANFSVIQVGFLLRGEAVTRDYSLQWQRLLAHRPDRQQVSSCAVCLACSDGVTVISWSSKRLRPNHSMAPEASAHTLLTNISQTSTPDIRGMRKNKPPRGRHYKPRGYSQGCVMLLERRQKQFRATAQSVTPLNSQ